MNKRILIASFIGAVAMFLWTFIAHMVLPLGEAGVQQIASEEPLLTAMSGILPEHGLYLFPNMPANNDQDAYYRKLAGGPSGMLIYYPKREFSFGKTLGTEFLTMWAQSLLAMWLLSTTRMGTFAGRFGFFAIMGLAAVITSNVSYWNWYGFPALYTLAFMLTGWISYLCAGAVAAAMKIGG